MFQYHRVLLGLAIGIFVFPFFSQSLQAKDIQFASMEVNVKQRNNRLSPLRLVLIEGRRWAIRDPEGLFQYLTHPNHLPSRYEVYYSLNQSEQVIVANIINSVNSQYLHTYGRHVPYTSQDHKDYIYNQVSAEFRRRYGRSPSFREYQGINSFTHNKLREIYILEQRRRNRQRNRR